MERVENADEYRSSTLVSSDTLKRLRRKEETIKRRRELEKRRQEVQDKKPANNPRRNRVNTPSSGGEPLQERGPSLQSSQRHITSRQALQKERRSKDERRVTFQLQAEAAPLTRSSRTLPKRDLLTEPERITQSSLIPSESATLSKRKMTSELDLPEEAIASPNHIKMQFSESTNNSNRVVLADQ